MDTTYFDHQWGVMVLYDARSKRTLTVVAVERKTNALYTQAVAALQEKGVLIQSIICDGKSGLLGSFPDIPVQMCQFHQVKIIVRHLTRKPKSLAAQALRAAYNSLKRHLSWLFTCECFPDLGIPNTTNLLEGKFSEMKQLLRCHRGLKKERKLRFIKDYFAKNSS